MSNQLRFQNKTVLITGGTTGVGFATAKRFAQEGASVVITGRRSEAGKEAVQRLHQEGLNVLYMQGDVSDAQSVHNIVSQVFEQFGKLDILINNAAVFEPIPFLGGDRERWRKVFDIIVNGTFFCSQEVAEKMVEKKIQGSIINVSSINSSRALEESSSYNAAKGAMDQLTRNTAFELIDYGIRVNGVSLGFIDTPMSIVDGENELETEWFKDIYVKRKKIPQRRAGQPDEVAKVILFLASEDASYMCGAIVPVDGGLSITF